MEDGADDGTDDRTGSDKSKYEIEAAAGSCLQRPSKFYFRFPIFLDSVRRVSTCFLCAGFIPEVRIDTIRSVS